MAEKEDTTPRVASEAAKLTSQHICPQTGLTGKQYGGIDLLIGRISCPHPSAFLFHHRRCPSPAGLELTMAHNYFWVKNKEKTGHPTHLDQNNQKLLSIIKAKVKLHTYLQYGYHDDDKQRTCGARYDFMISSFPTKEKNKAEKKTRRRKVGGSDIKGKRDHSIKPS